MFNIIIRQDSSRCEPRCTRHAMVAAGLLILGCWATHKTELILILMCCIFRRRALRISPWVLSPKPPPHRRWPRPLFYATPTFRPRLLLGHAYVVVVVVVVIR